MASSKAYNPLETHEDDVESGDERHLYFLNRCCDFRRAVLVLNTISVLPLLNFTTNHVDKYVFYIYARHHMDEAYAALDDEVLCDAEIAAFREIDLAIAMFLCVLWGIGIVSSAIALYGALRFKRWAIVTAMWFYGFALVVTILVLDFLDGIFYGLAVYAHWHMAKLMEAGIMTDENYHNIAACCGK